MMVVPAMPRYCTVLYCPTRTSTAPAPPLPRACQKGNLTWSVVPSGQALGTVSAFRVFLTDTVQQPLGGNKGGKSVAPCNIYTPRLTLSDPNGSLRDLTPSPPPNTNTHTGIIKNNHSSVQ